ncbi:reduced folate transporter isoform X1 [Alosa sapidissima]|uniref:reduced folate transporter isoform X1 n=2 Tax=Alosa sapidissima TaxID=34773 RepID=UPI001C0A5ADB|nr:reduced folate transporter isoform X1 [Alosa sapidissima]
MDFRQSDVSTKTSVQLTVSPGQTPCDPVAFEKMVDSLASGDGVKDSGESLAKEENGHLPDHEEPQPVPPKSKADPEAQTGMPPRAWKWSVIFLCFYGFMVQLKPGEPFITPYLLSMEKNFTKEEVTNEIIPVLSYSYMVVLVPVFLLTDYLRYKPVLVLQSMSHVSIWLLLYLGSTLLEMQFMEFFYGITMAARVAYSSYIFSLVPPSEYQRVASYSRTCVLMGVFASSVLGQLCVSLGNVTYATLSAVSLGFVSLGLLLSTCLPWPGRSMFFNKTWRAEEAKKAAGGAATQAELAQMRPSGKSATLVPSSSFSSSWKDSVFVSMLKELRNVVRVPSLRLWSLWWIFNSTGYYLVLFYVHTLWNKLAPSTENKVYNGGVEAASTLLGAITSFAAGYLKIRWKLWSELVIGGITAIMAALLLLMGSTENIWVCYVTYILFRGFYQFLVPIAIFQIASSLTKELCALVFGVNTFLGTIFKSIITLIIADKRGLALPVESQFFVYFGFFVVLTGFYLASAAWVITQHYRNTHKEGEVPPTAMSPIESEATESEPLSNGGGVKT